jgi:hypothetical protein
MSCRDPYSPSSDKTCRLLKELRNRTDKDWERLDFLWGIVVCLDEGDSCYTVSDTGCDLYRAESQNKSTVKDDPVEAYHAVR